MKNLTTFPAVLLKKLVMTAAIGPVCFLFGTVYYLYANDKIFLCISLIVMVACLFKAAMLYLTISRKEYYELNGVCIRVADKPFSKYRKIRLLDDSMIETELMLKKESKILIGCRYRFYFIKKPENNLQVRNDYVMAALNGDNLLGYENLGEA